MLWSVFSVGQVLDVYAGMPFREATTIAKHLQSWSQQLGKESTHMAH